VPAAAAAVVAVVPAGAVVDAVVDDVELFDEPHAATASVATAAIARLVRLTPVASILIDPL
jgi:hypothetical protein